MFSSFLKFYLYIEMFLLWVAVISTCPLYHCTERNMHLLMDKRFLLLTTGDVNINITLLCLDATFPLRIDTV